MSTLTQQNLTKEITIHINEEAARVFEVSPEDDNSEIEILFNLWLIEIANKEPKPLLDLMKKMGKEAKSKGLTPKILESILDNE